MKKISFLFLVLLVSGFTTYKSRPSAGDFISAKPLPKTVCQDGTELTAYKIVYYTEDVKGSITPASGAFLFASSLPNNAGPLVSYQHGTIIDQAKVPSTGMWNFSIGCRYGKEAMVSAPDYLGLGESTGMHPYHHWKTEASASIDLIKASLAFAKSLSLQWNGKLFLAGYSQGGHSTLSVLKALSEEGAPFKVTATAGLSGAYDLSDTSIREMLKTPSPYEGSIYVGYVLAAYDRLYPDAQIRKLTLPAFDPFLDAFPLYDLNTIGALAPRYPKEMFSDATIEAVLTNKHHPFVKALADNNVYDFIPKSPVFLCYAGGDTSVPPGNSVKAYESFKALGADVSILNVGDELNHSSASGPCEDAAKAYFARF